MSVLAVQADHVSLTAQTRIIADAPGVQVEVARRRPGQHLLDPRCVAQRVGRAGLVRVVEVQVAEAAEVVMVRDVAVLDGWHELRVDTVPAQDAR